MVIIILAGGKGSRIGAPKADLLLGDKSLLEWTVLALGPLAAELLVVSSSAPRTLPAEVRLITGEAADVGPLGALAVGLQAAGAASFVTGCDTPFLQPALVRRLFELAEGVPAVAPCDEKGFHPLCGVYQPACLPMLAQLLADGERRISAFLRAIGARLVEVEELREFDPELRSFFNINTPADFALAQQLLQRLPQK